MYLSVVIIIIIYKYYSFKWSTKKGGKDYRIQNDKCQSTCPTSHVNLIKSKQN